MELNERIEYIMKLNRMNASAFADKIGVQPSSVSHILSGRNKPSLEFVQKILNAFPKVDTDWLISGKASNNVEAQIEPAENENEELLEKKSSLGNLKKIQRILIFYNDQSFEEYLPSSNQSLAEE